MNKTDLIADARMQIALAKINLADKKDIVAIENLRNATLQIARYNSLLRTAQRVSTLSEMRGCANVKSMETT